VLFSKRVPVFFSRRILSRRIHTGRLLFSTRMLSGILVTSGLFFVLIFWDTVAGAHLESRLCQMSTAQETCDCVL